MTPWDIISPPLATTVASAPLWGAVVAGLFAILLSSVGRKREQKDRRKTLYSEAFQAVLAWEEGLYRVRRRAADGSEDLEIKNRFHDLQELIAYYYGWLSIESAELGTSYNTLVNTVKHECEPLLQHAWADPPQALNRPTPPDARHPTLQQAKDAFLREVRKTFVGVSKTI